MNDTDMFLTCYVCFRFPNPAQICYLNSCLQSLLTLEDFVRAIACQEQVWSLNPEAALMRYSNPSDTTTHFTLMLYPEHQHFNGRDNAANLSTLPLQIIYGHPRISPLQRRTS